jgi:uncharacterized protein
MNKDDSDSNPTERANFDDLIKIANMKMPFGKYKGWALIDLPEPYVVWFSKEGFPEGELGRLLSQLYEIKANGLEYLFTPLKQNPSEDL